MLFLLATAAAAELDVLTLKSGEQVSGELIDLRDGQYWILLPDMKVRSYPMVEVVRVETGDAPAPTAPPSEGPLPLPEWDGRTVPTYDRSVAYGFDFGSSNGVRVRFRTRSRAVAHQDLTLGGRLYILPGFGYGPSLTAETAFFGAANVHPTLLASAGFVLMWGEFYPGATAGIGLQVDPDGPFELDRKSTRLNSSHSSVSRMPSSA